ncbi:hydantoinase/oxoprolinase family protein [Catenulispora rubra]|uniref:hydantoinase/oxoprolinase family protein n=1 Tax=Catenulispora rubra TaxID=280293 RepID=UPI0018924B2A|nr:hydantoinase/oxoprolinase family protein [Catenulispora rubra]
MAVRAAVDIGGTFTDLVLFDDATGALDWGKALSTPEDLIVGVFGALDAAGARPAGLDTVIHGSTVVVNALIERDGARTALVTTKGFRDVYPIGRINRPDAFNLAFTKHTPLLPRELIFELDERLDAAGEVLTPLDESGTGALADRLAALGVEAVAVVLLHAYRNPEHEVRAGQILRTRLPGCHITLSQQISREYREFERASTTVANAFVGPLVSRYLGRLQERLWDGGSTAALSVMQSSGGVTDVATVSRQCVQMLESGPAGGVVGAIALCRTLGRRDAIAFDMGGTTAKSAVIRDLTFPLASDYFLGGYATGLPIRIPCLDIVEVGTGGGSVAWLDAAGGVHVGPRSAGAEPGPACYGRGGTRPTITDAALLLGHLAPDGPIAGGLRLDPEPARAALAPLAAELGLDLVAAAAGVLAIGAAAMADSVRAVTTERGLDPRDFALVAYGGNGPLHVSLVARELGVTDVVIPPMPAMFSALGMLMADARYDVVQTAVRTVRPESVAGLEAEFADLETECAAGLETLRARAEQVRFLRAVDMRYVGQEHTVTLPMPEIPAGLGSTGSSDGSDSADGARILAGAFDAAHEERYGHSAPGEPVQVVSLRVCALGILPKPDLAKIPQGVAQPPGAAVLGDRAVVFDPAVGRVRCPVFDRGALLAGNELAGPAAIEEPTTTVLLRPGDRARVDDFGNLLVSIGASA